MMPLMMQKRNRLLSHLREMSKVDAMYFHVILLKCPLAMSSCRKRKDILMLAVTVTAVSFVRLLALLAFGISVKQHRYHDVDTSMTFLIA